MTELEHAIKHIKTRADAWAVKEVTEALQSISERLDKALSQEPTDAISREAVMEVINAHMDGEDKNTKAVLSDVMESVNELETLEQEPICDRDCEHCTWTECPIEPCDDMVSRLDKIRQIIAIPNSVIQEDVMKYQMICELLKDELPSVTQKSGKWIEHKNNGMHYIECPKCSSWFLRMYLTRNSYCPNCGAKLESEDKE